MRSNCHNCRFDVEDPPGTATAGYHVCTLMTGQAGVRLSDEQDWAIIEWIASFPEIDQTAGLPPVDADNCPGFEPKGDA